MSNFYNNQNVTKITEDQVRLGMSQFKCFFDPHEISEFKELQEISRKEQSRENENRKLQRLMSSQDSSDQVRIGENHNTERQGQRIMLALSSQASTDKKFIKGLSERISVKSVKNKFEKIQQVEEDHIRTLYDKHFRKQPNDG